MPGYNSILQDVEKEMSKEKNVSIPIEHVENLIATITRTVYPMLAGRSYLLEQSGEEKAAKNWSDAAIELLDSLHWIKETMKEAGIRYE